MKRTIDSDDESSDELFSENDESESDHDFTPKRRSNKKPRAKKPFTAQSHNAPTSTAVESPGGMEYCCSLCQKEFNKLSGLRSHEARVHCKNGESRIWHCSISLCSDVFDTVEDMEDHVIQDHDVARFRRVRSANRTVPSVVNGMFPGHRCDVKSYLRD
jgi:hypothetical protein